MVEVNETLLEGLRHLACEQYEIETIRQAISDLVCGNGQFCYRQKIELTEILKRLGPLRDLVHGNAKDYYGRPVGLLDVLANPDSAELKILKLPQNLTACVQKLTDNRSRINVAGAAIRVTFRPEAEDMYPISVQLIDLAFLNFDRKLKQWWIFEDIRIRVS